MAYLRELSRCSWLQCSSRVSVELFDRRNKSRGRFCKKHGQPALKDRQRFEKENPPRATSTLTETERAELAEAAGIQLMNDVFEVKVERDVARAKNEKLQAEVERLKPKIVKCHCGNKHCPNDG